MQIINKLFKIQKIYICFILKLVFIILFSTGFLYADTFKVSDIEISSPFELGFNKNKVIDDGFQDSFTNLIAMITTPGDREKKLKKIPLKELKGMIDSFIISDEKFISNEYFAKLEVKFNKKKILSFLEDKNIFPSMPIKNKVLLIPILVDVELDKVYFFTGNIFYKKWNEYKKNYHLLEYLLPSEDLEDLKDIQQMSSSIEKHDFINLITKYDLQDYIITVIYKDKNQLRILSKINLNESLNIDNQKFEKINFSDKKNLETVIEKMKNIYENNWKKNNQINTSIKLPLSVSVDSKNYNKIEKFEKVISSMDLVSDFYILKFNSNDVFYKIIYNGSPKTFLNDLSKENINLVKKNDIWSIK